MARVKQPSVRSLALVFVGDQKLTRRKGEKKSEFSATSIRLELGVGQVEHPPAEPS
jgi:hypothetical protein